MVELINIITDLIKDNEYISEFIDRNMELIKTDEIDILNEETSKFYSFMNVYSERNNKFKILMQENNFSSVWDIDSVEGFSKNELHKLIKDFESSVKESQTKLTLYAKLISGELNMINKIKYFKTSGNIDFKL